MSAMTIPRGLAGVPHHLAALALFLAGVEASTGALLSAHYVPTHAEAHARCCGWWRRFRSGSCCARCMAGADLLVVTVWLAVLASALDGGWRRPRAASWSALVLLGFVTLYAGLRARSCPGRATAPRAPRWRRRRGRGALGGRVAASRDARRRRHGRGHARARVGCPRGPPAGVASALLVGAAAQRVARPASPEDDTPSMPLAPHFLLRVGAMGTATTMALVLLAVFATPGWRGGGGACGAARRRGTSAVSTLLRAMPSRVIGVPGATVAVLLGLTAGAGLVALPWIDPRASRPRVGWCWRSRSWCGGTVYARFA